MSLRSLKFVLLAIMALISAELKTSGGALLWASIALLKAATRALSFCNSDSDMSTFGKVIGWASVYSVIFAFKVLTTYRIMKNPAIATINATASRVRQP